MERKYKNLFYWVFQIIGWSIFGAFLFASIFAFSEGPPNPKVIHLQIIIILVCFVLSHLLRSFYKKQKWYELSLIKVLPRIIITSLISATLAQIIIHLLMITVLDWSSFRSIVISEIPMYIANVFVVYLVWSIIYFSYQYYEKAQDARFAQIESEKALKEAELIALKAQINPHFMFNALNNIRAMVLEDTKKAREMISNLSELLKYSIQFNANEKVKLKDEIKIVKDYLNLESVQYEDRIKYHLEIEIETLEKEIPPMVIQLMVENAVKHGISQLNDGGKINIKTYLDANNLVIEVSNTGKLKKSGSSGIGLKNAVERIRIVFNKEPVLSLTQISNEVLAQLKIPTA